MPNGAHFRFMSTVLQLAQGTTTLAGRFSTQVSAFSDAINVEDSFFLVSRKSALTDQIAEHDSLRDDIYIGYKYVVKGFMYLPDGEELESARKLWQHIVDYGIDTQAQLDVETGMLMNFTADLEKVYAEDVENIGATRFVTELKKENELVNQLLLQRDQENAQRTISGLKNARKDTDAAYHDLVAKTNAVAELEDNEDVTKFIAELNELIARMREEITNQPSSPSGGDDDDDKPVTGGSDGDDGDENLPSVQ